MKAKKKVTVVGDVRITEWGKAKPKRTPTVRKIKSAIVPIEPGHAAAQAPRAGTGRARVETGGAAVADLGAPSVARPTLAERAALDRIDVSVDLVPSRGLRPGGMLNSIGLQNPGVDAVIEKYGPIWQGWDVPVIVNIAGESIEDYVEVARRVDGVPGVAGIELNISCPNVGKGGLQFAIDRDAARAVTAAVRRATELPLMVKLSPNVADVRPIAKAIEEAGADAISAINTLSGLAVSPDRKRALLGNTFGGLSGPAIKPVALRIVYEVAQVVSIPIVAIGGVTSIDDVLDFLACGAVAVQVGTAIFADPELPVRLADELRAECLRRGLESYRPLIGTALPRRAGASSAKGVEYRP
jgi:dihydroorotate dehydrogenase (NAD+) catalytic subunit